MNYKVTEAAGTLHLGDKTFAPGDAVEIKDEAVAQPLLDCGAIEDAKPAKGEKTAA